MNNFIKFNENNNFLSPINSILNSYATKEDFEYSMMLISKISNPLERLEIFNEFMTQIFIKVSQGTVNDDLEHIIYKEDFSKPLADFLKTFGNNWDKIKTSIPPNKQELFENAITYSRNNIKFQALKDTSFKLSKEKRINLINSLDLDDQKEYFLSNEQINNYKFTSDDICNILSNFSHDKRKLNYLTKSLEEIHLGKKQILQIAYSLNFDSNIAKFLKPANVNFFKFSSSDCTNILQNCFGITNVTINIIIQGKISNFNPCFTILFISLIFLLPTNCPTTTVAIVSNDNEIIYIVSAYLSPYSICCTS